MSIIKRFFTDIDARWKETGTEPIRLQLIGSTALMLQADYTRGTKDSDVIETAQLEGEIGENLLALAGKDTGIHRRHRIYLDLVASGLPFLQQSPIWHAVADLNATLRHFEIVVLDVVDVVVSKLKRFNADDVSDIEAMVERDLVSHEVLLERFGLAVDWYSMDARSHDLPRYVQNLNRVERDILSVAETEIELPGWI